MYVDANNDGVDEGDTESGVVRRRVFVDHNNDGVLNHNEIFTWTGPNGDYTLAVPAAGRYRLTSGSVG